MPELFRDAALRMIRAIPGYKDKSFLELGCGDGFIMDVLTKEGVKDIRGTTYRDRGTDYIRTRDYPEHLTVDGGIDLNKPLPYESGKFDVVYSTEVIEHIEGHRNFIVEASRVLRPGGCLVLTSPNLHRIMSRLRFFLSGQHLTKQKMVPVTDPIERMEQYHIRCVDFPLLHYMLWKTGLRVQDMTTTEVYGISKVAAIASPIFGIFTKQDVYRHAGQTADEQQQLADLNKWMNHNALLTSEQFCIRAQKAA